MELDYKNYFTKEDLRVRGYNLEADGVLDISHFDTLEDAINDFMDNTLRAVYNLFVQYRGRKWTDAFFDDMTQENLSGTALDYQERLKRALIEQAIFIYDNGDSNANASYDDRASKSELSPKAVAELWDILIW